MPVKFTKVLISDEHYESAAVFDVNNDGVLDIVSGGFWYEGPDFKTYHKIADLPMFADYYDDFSTIPLDVNGDGYTDFVTGGWWGNTIRWRENPGEKGGEWPEHIIDETGNIETTRAWDIDGDGILEIVPNTPGNHLAIYKLITDKDDKGTGEFAKHVIYEGPQGHGLGYGDVNGDGRGDFILTNGWLEAPEDLYNGEWIFHQEFDFGGASVPILVADVNGDGLNDLIVGQAHGYGLDWYEQQIDAQGNRTWKKHPIDPFNSQYHDMMWLDIDGDGECELVTGKRYRAHKHLDPGDSDDYGTYYFKWNGESFSKQVIDYGKPMQTKGIGIYFDVADLHGTGRLDIIAPGKDGLFVFYNEGSE